MQHSFYKGLIPVFAFMAVPLSAHPHEDTQVEEAAEQEEATQADSPFVGRYDGGQMEMAMGMIIRADGTFGWGVSVGALDMRAAGTWTQEDDTIILTSDPKPVAPEFGWPGMETVPDGKLLRIVWASNGEPFQYGSVRAICANGEVVFGQVPTEGWSPPETCDEVVNVQLKQDIYDVTSQVYDLTSTFTVSEGETIRFEFRRNDMGVADFSGVTGQLNNGLLTLQGGRWPMELRKLPPQD